MSKSKIGKPQLQKSKTWLPTVEELWNIDDNLSEENNKHFDDRDMFEDIIEGISYI